MKESTYTRFQRFSKKYAQRLTEDGFLIRWEYKSILSGIQWRTYNPSGTLIAGNKLKESDRVTGSSHSDITTFLQFVLSGGMDHQKSKLSKLNELKCNLHFIDTLQLSETNNIKKMAIDKNEIKRELAELAKKELFNLKAALEESKKSSTIFEMLSDKLICELSEDKDLIEVFKAIKETKNSFELNTFKLV